MFQPALMSRVFHRESSLMNRGVRRKKQASRITSYLETARDGEKPYPPRI
jgi:hypothetical protein